VTDPTGVLVSCPATGRISDAQTRSAAGMTLIELVIVITLSAICVTFMTMFVVTPINAYNAQTQRAQLVDAADSALRLLSRDLRAALPNSVRIANERRTSSLSR
jgi:MSHA biogenesis protein MshO